MCRSCIKRALNIAEKDFSRLNDLPAAVNGGVAPAAPGDDGITTVHNALVSDAERTQPVQVVARPGIVRIFR